ncbi:MAG: EamA family transporter [Myxococcales bacterium]
MAASEQRKGVLFVAAAALLWSSGGLFIKLAPMPGLAVACGRSAVTAIFYLIVLRPRLSKASWSTAFAYAAMILTFVTATKLTTAANAIFLQYTGPAYVLMLSPWVLKERLQRIDIACVVLSLLGMSLFFVGRVEAGQVAGNLLGVASGAFFGLTVLLLRRDAAGGKSGGDAMPSTALGNILAAAVALPFAAPSIGAALTPLGAVSLLYLGIVQLGVAYLLFAKGLKRVPASEASLVSMLEPVFNPLWVFLGTGERPGPWALLGGAVVIGAVVARTLWREPSRGGEVGVASRVADPTIQS